MRDLTRVYTKGYYKARQALGWRAQIMADAVQAVFKPTSVVDFGCGCGDILQALLVTHGIEIFGIEASDNARPALCIDEERFAAYDMRKPIDLKTRFRVATCWNVIPHIEEEFAVQAIRNMLAAADYIAFNAYEKPTSSYWDSNCQPKAYWETLLFREGCYIESAMVLEMRTILKPYERRTEIARIRDNLFIAKKLRVPV